MPANDPASQSQSVNIWAQVLSPIPIPSFPHFDAPQMSYVPPRGPCSQKNSMLISCSCYRFMVHPLKAATSFDCDGCGHHASFHKMDNPLEADVLRRWKEMDADNDALRLEGFRQGVREVEEVAPKRRRTADGTAALEVEQVLINHRRFLENPERKRIRKD